MGSSPNSKNKRKDIKKRNLQNILSECKLIPEILDINFDKSTIKFHCPFHGDNILDINDYLKKEIKDPSEIECKYIKNHKKKEDKNNYIISNYCLNCNSYICQSCSKNHEHKTLELKDLRSKEQNIKPSDNDIEIIKNKIDNLYNCKKLLDILINTYEKDSSNINNNNSIHNVIKSINKNVILGTKLDNVQTKLKNYFKGQLSIDITGEEKILDLSHKNITNVEFNLLSGMDLPNLQKLDLKYNKITNLEPLENTNLINLESIDVSNNIITEVKPLKNNSKNNEKLKNINLSYNLIKNVDKLKENISTINIKFNLDGNKEIEKDLKEIKSIIGYEPNNINNELILTYKFNEYSKEIKILGEKFVENNKNNCKLKIYDEEKDIQECYTFKKNTKKISIKLIMNQNVTNMSYMFHNCISLLSLENNSNLDFSNVTDMSYMFYGCTQLYDLINLYYWDTSKVNDMNHMFYQCQSITFLNGIMKWNISNVKDMSYMFYECIKLKALPYIGHWNIANVTKMNYMFSGCSSLSILCGIKKWNISKLTEKEDMFNECPKILNYI